VNVPWNGFFKEEVVIVSALHVIYSKNCGQIYLQAYSNGKLWQYTPRASSCTNCAKFQFAMHSTVSK